MSSSVIPQPAVTSQISHTINCPEQSIQKRNLSASCTQPVPPHPTNSPENVHVQQHTAAASCIQSTVTPYKLPRNSSSQKDTLSVSSSQNVICYHALVKLSTKVQEASFEDYLAVTCRQTDGHTSMATVRGAVLHFSL
jgi:hypothetical protein